MHVCLSAIYLSDCLSRVPAPFVHTCLCCSTSLRCPRVRPRVRLSVGTTVPCPLSVCRRICPCGLSFGLSVRLSRCTVSSNESANQRNASAHSSLSSVNEPQLSSSLGNRPLHCSKATQLSASIDKPIGARRQQSRELSMWNYICGRDVAQELGCVVGN